MKSTMKLISKKMTLTSLIVLLSSFSNVGVFTCLRVFILTVFKESYLFIRHLFTSLSHRVSYSTSRKRGCDCHYSNSPKWVCIADFKPSHMLSEFYLVNMVSGSNRYACCYSCRKLFITMDADADKEMLSYSFESDTDRDIERESKFEVSSSGSDSDSGSPEIESITPIVLWSPLYKDSGQVKLPGLVFISRWVANSLHFLPGGLSYSLRRRINSGSNNINDKNLETLQKEHDNLLFTRENLTLYIMNSYLSLKESIYSSLSELSYKIIITKVSKGLYTLSPLEFIPIPKEGVDPKSIPFCRNLLFHSSDDHYYHIKPTLEDSIVLTSLGYLMYHRFESFCFSPYYRSLLLPIDDHYSAVCQQSSKYHYLLDLSRTSETINRDAILVFLAHFIEDDYIFSLIKDYIFHDDGKSLFVGIPLIGFFSDVLMNIFFQICDITFEKAFPSAHYTRYMHEVIISSNEVINISEINHKVFNLSTEKNEVIQSTEKNEVLSSNKDIKYPTFLFSGSLNEIISVTKCYGGELIRNMDGKLIFNKSSSLDDSIMIFKNLGNDS